jgi:hypothetical protein
MENSVQAAAIQIQKQQWHEEPEEWEFLILL